MLIVFFYNYRTEVQASGLKRKYIFLAITSDEFYGKRGVVFNWRVTFHPAKIDEKVCNLNH